MDEKNPMEMADIKVDSEEFCDANYDGTRWIIFCSSIVWFYIDFIVTLITCFITIFSFLSKMDHSIQMYLCVLFGHAEEMASVYEEIDIKNEPLFPSLECNQVCSVFFMILIITSSDWDNNKNNSCPLLNPLWKLFKGDRRLFTRINKWKCSLVVIMQTMLAQFKDKNF